MVEGTTLSSFVIKHLYDDVHLHRFLSILPKLGLKSRKSILDLCQTEIDAFENPNLIETLLEIKKDYEVRTLGGRPTLGEIEGIVERMKPRVIYRSFVSMMVRSEILDQHSKAEEAIEEGFLKELYAGQNERPKEHGINYQCMDPDNYHPQAYSIHITPAPWWLGKAKGFVHRLANKLETLGILYPQVQRKKNMSQDTCRELHEFGYRIEGVDWKDYRTLDLELMKMKTGMEIQGNCEMRMTWGFNILKPRFYYACGGSNYWRSRHMKKFAVLAMESLETTKLERRSDPCVIDYTLQADHWLALWDLTSFTTQLSELKHFLYYVSKALSEDLRVQQRPLRLLDYADGIMEITADKFLDMYNQGENYNAPYSIWRVVQKVYQNFEADETKYQMNSGMLGVPGNIGLSTAFHGFHIEAAIVQGTGCCVGDDGLGGSEEDPRYRLIPHLQLIGDLQMEKVTIMEPLREYDFEQVAKFLKRRLSRTHTGLTLGLLFAFPNLTLAFPVKDDYHTISDEERSVRIHKFVGQVGALFWDIHATGFIDEAERELLRRVLILAYRKLGLDTRGSLPGRRHEAFEDGMMFAVPPLFFDPSSEDWAEYLWDSTSTRYAELPISLGPTLIPDFEPGLEFEANAGGMINVLEDVGCVKKIRLMTELVEVNNTNRRRFRSFLSGMARSYRCRFTNFQPSWFRDVFSDDKLDRVPTHDVI